MTSSWTLPQSHNVSRGNYYKTWLDYNKPSTRFPGPGYNFNSVRLPNNIPGRRADGLTAPTNETCTLTVFSPSHLEHDWYDNSKNSPGTPLWVNNEVPIFDSREEIRADLPLLNMKFEEEAVRRRNLAKASAGIITGNGNVFGSNNIQKKHRLDGSVIASSGIAITGVPVTHDELWPKDGWTDGRAKSMLKRMGSTWSWSDEDTDIVVNYGDEVTDYRRKWSFSGFTRNAVDDGSILDEVRTYTRSIALAVGGDSEVANLFSSRLAKGDRLYFIVVPVSMQSFGSNIKRPNGQHGGPGVGTGVCMQIRGVSSRDSFDTENLLSDEKVESKTWNGIAWGPVNDWDKESSIESDYILRRRVLKREGFIVENDEMGKVLLRPTDDPDDLPPSVFDIYSLGWVQRVGIVAQLPSEYVTELTISEAHRDAVVMQKLPRLRAIVNAEG